MNYIKKYTKFYENPITSIIISGLMIFWIIGLVVTINNDNWVSNLALMMVAWGTFFINLNNFIDWKFKKFQEKHIQPNVSQESN